MLYLDTDARRLLARERAAWLAEDYRQAPRAPGRRPAKLDLLRRLRVRVAPGPGISLTPRS
jgi:hypothetical protein